MWTCEVETVVDCGDLMLGNRSRKPRLSTSQLTKVRHGSHCSSYYVVSALGLPIMVPMAIQIMTT
jgi:hypothetical protein